MGRIVQRKSGNGVTTQTTYDSDNFTSSVVTTNSQEEVLSALNYTYDAVGNKLSMTNENNEVTRYSYDKAYRLTGVEYPARLAVNSITEDSIVSKSVSYSYDAAGNRIEKVENGETIQYQYNEANQLLHAGDVRYSYDENGNRISKVDETGTTTYSYDANNQMIAVTTTNEQSIRYGFDALNRRVTKTVDDVVTSYLYDGAEILMQVGGEEQPEVAYYYRANGQIQTQQRYSFTSEISSECDQGNRLTYSYDDLGSVTALSNDNGALKTRYLYDAYGKIVEGDLTNNQFTFTGQFYDVESKLYHFFFREYDAETGVWTSPDPIGIIGGLNLYMYVGNNPVNLKDLFGLEVDEGEDGFDDQGNGGWGTESESEANSRTGSIDSDTTNEDKSILSNFFEGVKSYFTGFGRGFMHSMRRSGILGKRAQIEAIIEEKLAIGVLKAIYHNKTAKEKLVDAIIAYAKDNKARVTGRVLTGTGVNVLLGSAGGLPGTAVGIASAGYAVFGDVKQTINQTTEDIINSIAEAIIGGEVQTSSSKNCKNL